MKENLILAVSGLKSGNYIFIAVVINVLSVWLMCLRYKIFLRYLKEKISLFNSFCVISTAQFANYITPFRVGNVATRPLASKIFAGVSLRKSLLATIFELVIDTFWQIILLIFILILMAEKFLLNQVFPKILIVATFFAIAIITIAYRRQIVSWLWKNKGFFQKVFKQTMSRLNLSREKMDDITDEVSNYIFNIRLFLLSLLPVTIIILLLPFLLQYSGKAFCFSLNYSSSFIIFWLSFIVGRLSGVPGGLGLGDITMGGMLIKAGVAPSLALKVILLYRVVTMVIPHVLIGGPLFVIMGKRMALKGIKKLKR